MIAAFVVLAACHGDAESAATSSASRSTPQTTEASAAATTAVERVLKFAEVGQRVEPGEVLPGVGQLVTWERPDDGAGEFDALRWGWRLDSVIAVDDPFPAELVGMVGDDGLPVGWRALSLQDAALQTWNASLSDGGEPTVSLRGEPVDVDGNRSPLSLSAVRVQLGDVLEFGGWWVKVGAIGGAETREQVVYLWVLQPDGQFSIPGAELDPIAPPTRPDRPEPQDAEVKPTGERSFNEVALDDVPNWREYLYPDD